MDIQALGMLSNITAIVQKQNVNTIEGDINVEKDFYGTLREQQINCVKEDIYKSPNKSVFDSGITQRSPAIINNALSIISKVFISFFDFLLPWKIPVNPNP